MTHLSGERSSMAGALAESWVEMRVVSTFESLWVKEAVSGRAELSSAFPGGARCARAGRTGRSVGHRGTCPRAQPRGSGAVGVGAEGRGRRSAKETTQLARFCLHSLRHASVRPEPADTRARVPRAVAFPARGLALRPHLPGSPPPREEPQWGLGLPGAPLDVRAEPKPPPSRAWTLHGGGERRGGRGPRARATAAQLAPPASPAEKHLLTISSKTPLFLLEQVNVRVGLRGPRAGSRAPPSLRLPSPLRFELCHQANIL